MQFSEMDQQSLDDLKEAIEQALRSGELFDPEQRRADAAAARKHVRTRSSNSS